MTQLKKRYSLGKVKLTYFLIEKIIDLKQTALAGNKCGLGLITVQYLLPITYIIYYLHLFSTYLFICLHFYSFIYYLFIYLLLIIIINIIITYCLLHQNDPVCINKGLKKARCLELHAFGIKLASIDVDKTSSGSLKASKIGVCPVLVVSM